MESHGVNDIAFVCHAAGRIIVEWEAEQGEGID